MAALPVAVTRHLTGFCNEVVTAQSSAAAELKRRSARSFLTAGYRREQQPGEQLLLAAVVFVTFALWK